jgi:hypothetical protein
MARPAGAPPTVGAVPSVRAHEPQSRGFPEFSLARSDEPAPTKEKLAFTAAYPSSVAAGAWHDLLVLLHGSGRQREVSAVLENWKPRLGGQPSTSMATSATGIERGTTLTLVPSADGVRFNPERIDVAWREDVQEVPFRLEVPAGTAAGLIAGRVDVLVGTLPVATVSFGLDVAAAPVDRPQQTVSRAEVFERVFASYSRRDQEVVRACIALYEAMGVTVLVDQADLKSGDDWRDKLHKLITDADIFQLYWSSASSASTEVGSEWHFALDLNQSKGSRFIRPVYWESPMPAPPPELAHVHFSRIDIEKIGNMPAGESRRRPWYTRLWGR